MLSLALYNVTTETLLGPQAFCCTTWVFLYARVLQRTMI